MATSFGRATALVAISLAVSLLGCGDDSLGALGEECVSTTDCNEGLTCDLGQTPPVCSEMQTPRPDASTRPPIDGAVIDANRIDADPLQPDARPAPDAMIDATPPMIDAMPPDAMIDAML